ncbi:MAG: M50 family metallopeptidase [Acidobacteriota bacterium]
MVNRDSSPQPSPLTAPLAALAVLFLLLWLAPAWASMPLRALATVVHEMAHGLSALATGGRFVRFVLYPDGSGLAYTQGGWQALVTAAGYLGVACFAALLLVLGGGRRSSRWTLGILSGAILLLGLRYGFPTLLAGELGPGLWTLGSCLGMGGVGLAVALRGGPLALSFTLDLAAFYCAVTAFNDLWVLYRLPGEQASDAQNMARLTGLPPSFWAVAWALMAVVVTVVGMRLAWSLRSSGR